MQATFSPILVAIEQVRAGKLCALAGTGASPSQALPGIPTVAEFVPGYEAIALKGVGAPKDTPREIIAKLNDADNAGLADSELQSRLAELGSVPAPMTPSEFANLIFDETEKWGRVLKSAGIKAV